MKRLCRLFLVLVVASTMVVGCKAFRSISSGRVSSQGAPYELIVVCNQPEWEGVLGENIRATFSSEIPYLQQIEPKFEVLRVTNQGYTNLVTKHRNVLKCVVAPSLEQSSVVVEWDVDAAPQVVATLQGPTAESMASYVAQHHEALLQLFEGAERDRSIYFAKNFSVASLDRLIKQKFGVTMYIPQGYTLRAEGEDFVWISAEHPTASQGVVIYSYPVGSSSVKESLSLEALLAARNSFVARIPGPSDGSYMTTFTEVDSDFRAFRLEGRLWSEVRGFWEVEGDFMGGPFVSYSTIDTTTNRVFTVDFYVYSPKLGKRNFLRSLEHLLYSIEMPS